MAPERLDDGAVDGRSDIYSLGVMGQAFASDVGVSAVVTKADPEALVSTIRSVLGGRGGEVG